jgi:hypothetical protein
VQVLNIVLSSAKKSLAFSIRGGGEISKTRDADLRKAFYMPALVYMRFGPAAIKKY